LNSVFENETPIAWSVLEPGAEVVASDGSGIGAVAEVRGDREADIFHSVVVRRDAGGDVEIPSGRITRMTERHVMTDLGAGEADALAG
jgi:hypothetical protein